MRHVLFVATVLVLFSSVTDSQTRFGTAEDEEAIRQRRQTALAAVNKRDSQAIAAFFTPDVDRVRGNGVYHSGREDVEKSFARPFNVFIDGSVSQDTSLKEESSRIRFLTNDVALLDIVVVQGDGKREQRERSTVVYVKRDGVWMTAAIRNTPIR